jgi:hypothetical protein
MEEGNFAVIVDAKSEYTKQLVNTLKGGIYYGIKKIFNECRDKCQERGELSDVLTDFQGKLEEIPKWNQEVILGECDTLLTESKCDWIEDLITAVFVSHTRVLTSINFSKNKRQINLKVPKTDHFIHQCYVDVARIFYKAPYLMDDTGSRYEFQRNRNESEVLIEKSIENTIRKQLPVKHILQEYLGNDYVARENEPEVKAEGEVETNTVEETPKLSDLSMDIKELVKTEIENSVKAQETLPEPQEVALESVKESNLESIVEPVVETLETPIEVETNDEPEVEALHQSVAQEKIEETPETETETETIPEVESLDLEPPEYSEQEDFGGLDLDLDIDLSTEVDLGGAPEYEDEPVQEPNIESFIEEPSVKSLNLNESHSVLSGENVPSDEQNTEVKTILLDTKNSLSDEDIEKKRNLKNKKAFNFFNDSVEEADSE